MHDILGCALVRIGTRYGVRLEQLPQWTCGEDHVVLSCSNGFCDTKRNGVQIRVGGWDAGACSVSYQVSAARMRRPLPSALNYDGDHDDHNHPMDADNNNYSSDEETKQTNISITTTMLRRLTVASPKIKKRKIVKKKHSSKNKLRKNFRSKITIPRKSMIQPQKCSKNIELFLTDAEADVFYIWIISFPHESFRRSSITPHPFSPFTIENCCGSCKGLFDLDFKILKAIAMPRQRRGITGGDIVSTLGGTLSLYPDRYQIGFRGTRSMRMLANDWLSITGIPLDQTNVTAYMLVLKGQMGASVLLNGTLDPTGEEYEKTNDCASIMTRLPYIINRMQQWCIEARRNTDVCDSIELKGIQWASLLSASNVKVAEPLWMCNSSVSVTRRGGVMMRLIFPPETPWSAEMEDEVLSNCNNLLAVLCHAVSGKPMTCFEEKKTCYLY